MSAPSRTVMSKIEALGGKSLHGASKTAAEIVAGSYRQATLPGLHLHLATARGVNAIGSGDKSEDRLVPDPLHRIP